MIPQNIYKLFNDGKLKLGLSLIKKHIPDKLYAIIFEVYNIINGSTHNTRIKYKHLEIRVNNTNVLFKINSNTYWVWMNYALVIHTIEYFYYNDRYIGDDYNAYIFTLDEKLDVYNRIKSYNFEILFSYYLYENYSKYITECDASDDVVVIIRGTQFNCDENGMLSINGNVIDKMKYGDDIFNVSPIVKYLRDNNKIPNE